MEVIQEALQRYLAKVLVSHSTAEAPPHLEYLRYVTTTSFHLDR